MDAESQRKQRQHRIKKGLCVRCPNTPRPGKTLCRGCGVKMSKWNLAGYYRKKTVHEKAERETTEATG